MFKESLQQFKTAFLLLCILTFITGFVYPLIVTGLGQLFFPWQANGSLIQENDHFIGSYLIGQDFNSPMYFWGRPSATIPFPYNGASSSGSNLAPSNPILINTVAERIKKLHQADPNNKQAIPVDLVSASGSGLDPEISPQAALYQVSRVATTRHLAETDLILLINKLKINRTLGILGEPRINVLELNRALDHLAVLAPTEH